jgi:hypothetical protein
MKASRKTRIRYSQPSLLPSGLADSTKALPTPIVTPSNASRRISCPGWNVQDIAEIIGQLTTIEDWLAWAARHHNRSCSCPICNLADAVQDASWHARRCKLADDENAIGAESAPIPETDPILF